MHLGHVELPSDQEAGFLKKQMASEKFIIFDRLNRLVRCLVDCRVFDGDAVGVRTGLELIRAISANTWEDHPAQIQQVPGIGPVAMRKFQAKGVHTLLELAKLDFDHIERILSRKPPYGKNLCKVLEGFPQLTLRVEVMGAPGTYKKLGNSISVVVRAILGHKNQKHPPSWSGKIPAVTFLAETSDGKVAYFSRSNIKNINGSDGLELRFPISLSKPDEVVTCHFSCEEIVGTQVIEVVDVNTPASAFAGLDVQAPTTAVPAAQVDYMSKDVADNIADEDMLEALNGAPKSSLYSPKYDLLDSDEDGFPELEEVMDDQSPTKPAPTKMKNGRWMCNHYCRGGGLTKNGRPCTHRCCKEGLEKPRPPPKRKASEDHPPASTAKGKKTKSRHHSEDAPKQKRNMKKGNHNDQMVELVDLSGLTDDDDDDMQLAASTPEQAMYNKNKNKLSDLHRNMQGHNMKAPSRIIKSITKPADSPKPAFAGRSAPHPFELQYELEDSDAVEEEMEEAHPHATPHDMAMEHQPPLPDEISVHDFAMENQSPLPDEIAVPSGSHEGLGLGGVGDIDQPFFLDSNPFEVAVNAEAESSQSKAPEWASELSPEVMDLIKGMVEVDGWRP